MFAEFVDVLQAQLQECPPDFFADAISGDSFLRASLIHLVKNVMGVHLDDSGASESVRAVQVKLDGMLDWVKGRFAWDPRDEVVVASPPLDADGQPARGDDSKMPVRSLTNMMEEGDDLPVMIDEATGRELSPDEVAALLQGAHGSPLNVDGIDMDDDLGDEVAY